MRHHTVQVPATSANLGPGFDAFGLAVDRYLAVQTVDRAEQTSRVVIVRGDPVPDGDDNLVWRSFVAFCDRHGAAVPDVALRVANDIPLERGLGSSSAAIVAGLVLARALTDIAVGDPRLLELATEIEGHPDNVAPSLLGGLVACVGGVAGTDPGAQAHELVVRRVNPAPHLRPVLLVPETRQATSGARAVLPDTVTRAEAAAQASRAGHVLAALTGTWPVDVAAAADLLHEPARAAQMPAAAALLGELRDAGVHAWLSGAGPSVAAVVPAGAFGAPMLDAVAAIGARHEVEVAPARFELSGALACPRDGCAIAGGEGCVQCPRRRV